MKMRLRLPILLTSILFFSACDCFDPCRVDEVFTIVDKSTGKDLLFGVDAIYDTHAITFTNANYPQPIPVAVDSPRIYLPTGDTVYLRLNSVDIDTVVVKSSFSGSKSRCCPNGYSKVDTIRYNGRLATKQGNKYIFEK